MEKTRWRKWWSLGDISSVCNVDLFYTSNSIYVVRAMCRSHLVWSEIEKKKMSEAIEWMKTMVYT
jgi:hypothetical protein